jgi:hypothetical protein
MCDRRATIAQRAGPARSKRLEHLLKPPGRSLRSVRGNAAPRGMTAEERFHNGCELSGPAQGGVFLRKTPSECSSFERRLLWNRSEQNSAYESFCRMNDGPQDSPGGRNPAGAGHFAGFADQFTFRISQFTADSGQFAIRSRRLSAVSSQLHPSLISDP